MNLYNPCSTITVELIQYIQKNPNTLYHMDQFLLRYQNPIFNFIRLAIGDYHDSSDVTNRVLLTLSKKVREIKVKKSFNSLVLKVIKGELSNYWKGRKTQKSQILKQNTIWHNEKPISLLETLEHNESTAEEVFQLLMIRDIVENAPDSNMREIFWLKYREEKSITDIARLLNLTDYQVKKYLAEIHRQVEDYLKEN